MWTKELDQVIDALFEEYMTRAFSGEEDDEDE